MFCRAKHIPVLLACVPQAQPTGCQHALPATTPPTNRFWAGLLGSIAANRHAHILLTVHAWWMMAFCVAPPCFF
jgi:hypothetical protein